MIPPSWMESFVFGPIWLDSLPRGRVFPKGQKVRDWDIPGKYTRGMSWTLILSRKCKVRNLGADYNSIRRQNRSP